MPLRIADVVRNEHPFHMLRPDVGLEGLLETVGQFRDVAAWLGVIFPTGRETKGRAWSISRVYLLMCKVQIPF